MQIKAYDITKLLHVVTAELKSSVNRPLYRNKIKAYFVCDFGCGYRKQIGLHTVKVIYLVRIAGRRQVTVRFMN